MNTLEILPQAQRYLKKITDKRLNEIFIECLEKIRLNPLEVGEATVGDLKGCYTYKFRYQKVGYR
ncbi:MAG: type II toxin-antitoxin system RelE/ParE family toxin, partial [Selenomonadaceae bacterium]|nr:type II toxin-antitoxin system RelE/ParE family toxin [Selenomonadaceae bacterium]